MARDKIRRICAAAVVGVSAKYALAEQQQSVCAVRAKGSAAGVAAANLVKVAARAVPWGGSALWGAVVGEKGRHVQVVVGRIRR